MKKREKNPQVASYWVLRNSKLPKYIFFFPRADVPFSKLYYECREKFIVSNELTLRAQLTEFIDHKLIRLKTESDGSEAIYLLIDDNNLKLYIDELKDKI
jgi:hypothetical protein